MAIENIPVWPFEPDWNSPFSETLEWLTDVIPSPTGSEQRRSWRYFPRRTFEYDSILAGVERRLYDNIMTSAGAQNFYLPNWHDANFLSEPAAAGQPFLSSDRIETSKVSPGSVIVLLGDSLFDYELGEVDTVASGQIGLKGNLTRTWPRETRLFSTSVARLYEPPETVKQSDGVVSVSLRFKVVGANPDNGSLEGATGLQTYRNFPVLTLPPEDVKPLNAGVERMLAEIDNQTSRPVRVDVAGRPFTYQQYAWTLTGRADLRTFENLLQSLRGRAYPLWVPTFMDDMRLAVAVVGPANTITVERCGFAQFGGPRPDRQDIMIETINVRYFRRVTAAAYDSQGREVLGLNVMLQDNIAPDDVVRISFMTLFRLNQDAVVIEHQTDTDGVATAQVTFRSAPDTRLPTTAPF